MNFHRSAFNISDHPLHLSHEQLCDHLLELTDVSDAGTTPGNFAGLHAAESPSMGFHVVEDHLRACPLCAAELSLLQSALTTFREATTSYASQELSLLRARTPRRPMILPVALSSDRFYRKPFLWAVAAVLLVGATLGSVVPLSLHRQHARHSSVAAIAPLHQSSPASESDQALLEEVDDDLSTSVPSAMQPLSDPLSAQATDSSQESNSTPMSADVPARKITHE
jgi:hypothetical protein